MKPAAIVLFVAAAFAQSDPRPRFEAASVKVSDATSRMRMSTPPGKVMLTHIRMKDVIPFAYGLPPFLVEGGPGWFTTEYFDIVGELPGREGAIPQKQEALEALQVLVEERFHMRVRHDVRTLPIYRLTVAKSGFKLKEGEDLPDGTKGGFVSATESRLVRRKFPISNIAETLAWDLECHIEDETGLKGLYSFVLSWPHEEPGNTPPEGPIIGALRNQLGLNLERAKGPVKLVVIESAERPTGN